MKQLTRKYRVSVIIPTYNRCELLNYTLNSLLGQTTSKNDFEVIIGDDGSGDDTFMMAKKYQSLLNLKYIYQNDKGYRPGAARNKAVLQAEGYVCLFIDCGIILHSACIAEHIQFHAAGNSLHSAIGYVYGFDHGDAYEKKIKSLIDPFEPDMSIERLSKHDAYLDVREKQYKKYNYSIENLPASWFYFWTCHVSAVTSEVIKVGLFDKNYDGRWGVEDLDLGFRLQQADRKIFLLKDAWSIHYPHGKNKQERKLEGYENLKYFHNKFNTLATKVFFDRYLEESVGLKDINEAILELMNQEIKAF